MYSLKSMRRVFVTVIILSTVFFVASAEIVNEINLPADYALRHLENIRGELRTILEDSFVGHENKTLLETAAMAIISRCIHSETTIYWLQDVPAKIGAETILRLASLARSIVDGGASFALVNSLEQLTVRQANQTVSDWLSDQNIQTAGGFLRGRYEDYQKKSYVSSEIQYLLVYRPEDNNHGEIIAEFRSSHPTPPPAVTSRTVWDAMSWEQSGQDYVPPFILTIQGCVEKKYNFFSWVGRPTVSINFPSEVDSIKINSNRGFWDQLFDTIIDWSHQQIVNLGAWLSPSNPVPEEPIDNLVKPKINIEIPDSENDLSDEEIFESFLTEELSTIIEELFLTTDNLADISRENFITSQEISKIIQYSKEIAESNKNEDDDIADDKEKINPKDDKTDSPINSLICQTDILSSPSHYPVIINEVAWMGRTSSANHEWIELKNLSDEEINLNGWQISNQNKNLLITLSAEEVIAPRGLLLLVRTDNNILEAEADYIYAGALKNRDEAIYLFNENCQLQDFAKADPDWPAGENTMKRTMERRDNLEWQTSFSTHGTPKKTNSSGYLTPPEISPDDTSDVDDARDYSDNQNPIAHAGADQIVEYYDPVILDASLSGDNMGIVAYRWDTNNDGFYNHVLEEPLLHLPPGYFSPGDHVVTLQVADQAGNIDFSETLITVKRIPYIAINEIQFHGEDSRDEFIELYNPNLNDIDLSGWALHKKTSGGNESTIVSANSFQGIIPAQGYFVIANPQLSEDGIALYSGDRAPDLYYSGQAYYISSDNTILLYGPENILIDKVGYGNALDYEKTAFPDNPPPGISLGRKWILDKEIYSFTNNNANDFEWQQPTPGELNRPVEVSPSPDEDVFQDGSALSPFLIASCQDLLKIEDHLGAFYELVDNIDCYSTKDWNGGAGFLPIGQTGDAPFVGYLDGKGFRISGLFINNENGGGLFDSLGYPAQVKNLYVDELSIDARGYNIGGLSGSAVGLSPEEPIVIENVSIAGEINAYHDCLNAPQSVGGLLGDIKYVNIDNAKAHIVIEADHENGHVGSVIGGLVGRAAYANIFHSSAYGDISGWQNIGGLIGQTNIETNIEESFALVDVVGEKMLGGFIGHAYSISSIIQNNYSRGTVTGCVENGESIGGFVGESNEWIKYSYSVGAVSGKNSHGFIGSKPVNRSDPIQYSYYDINTSGRSGKNLGAEGLITSAMHASENFEGWDFVNVWEIDNNYPILKNNPPEN